MEIGPNSATTRKCHDHRDRMKTQAKTSLITGASSGLGKSLALAVFDAGYRMIGTTRDIDNAERTCPDLSGKEGIRIELDPGQKGSYDQFARCSQLSRA